MFFNLYNIFINITATFYSPFTRFWELLCGSLLAWLNIYNSSYINNIRLKFTNSNFCSSILHQWLSAPNAVENILSITGSLILISGFILIRKNSLFPGFWALFPVFSTTLIIAAGNQAWINKTILSKPWLIWFGLVSFPLYLWHWPLLTFAKIIEGNSSQLINLVVVILSIFLAWITYQIVEKPIRFSNNKVVISGLILFMILLGGIGYTIALNYGLVNRFNKLTPAYSKQIEKISNAWKFRYYPRLL